MKIFKRYDVAWRYNCLKAVFRIFKLEIMPKQH